MLTPKGNNMRSGDLLRRYAAGDRDFRRVNLCGQSFKGKDLSGADFSETDIRGASFTNTSLRGAKFCGATAGLPLWWATGLICVFLVLSVVSGALSALAGGYLKFLLVSSNFFNFVGGLILVGGFILLLIVTVHQGLGTALVAFATFLVFAFAGGLFVAGYGDGSGAGHFAFAVILALAGIMTGAIGGAVAFELAGVLAFSSTLIMALVGAFVFAKFGGGAVVGTRFGSFIFACLVVKLCAYISWRAWTGNEKYVFIRTIAVALAAIGGTSFRHANLTEVDFSQAKLQSTDCRRANLTRTCWRNCEKIDHIRPGNTYLQNANLRQLLVTGQGSNHNFDHQSLRGVNLQGTNLADASFIGADLSEANLQDADLSRAKLVQTQLDEANLTGATLTGATIEDWGITNHTELQGVRCKYVFMRLPTKENPNPRRKPDNWDEEFEDGDFADFIKPIVDTLDLYHNQGVDPRAIAISFKQLAENNPEAGLEIVAMEKRGKDKFLLRAATAPNADHSKLNAEYFKTYNQVKALAEVEVQALLAEKDSRIDNLENMINTMVNNIVSTALDSPKIYAENYHDLAQNKGVIMSEEKKANNEVKIDGGYFAAVGSFTGNNTGTVTGTQTISKQIEQKPSLSEAATEIKNLLNQLEETYPNATAAEKQTALAVTVQQEIKQNPTFRTRLSNAFKEGSIETLKVLFAPVGIPIEMIRGWIEAEAK